MTAPKRAEVRAAADVLRGLLARVEAGEFTAAGARDKAMMRRLEGALLGLDAAGSATR